MEPFRPLFRNPHLATIAGNFAQRNLDEVRFPVTSRCVETEKGVQVLMHSQAPEGSPKAEIVMVHGLEGSSNAGYMRSMSQLFLERGYATHRTNMRSCGGTESLANTMYHAGLTSDTLTLLRTIRSESTAPTFLVGFSLGGNVALKLAGELGRNDLLTGVCAVSTPIDLGASVRKMSRRENWLYESRFLSRLKERIRKRALSMPGHYDLSAMESAKSVYEFDDRVTAQHFGFGSADNYYGTQSSLKFLSRIAIPTLLVQAKDDPLIPFELFTGPEVTGNPFIRLIATTHGGHLGFIANAKPRFWLDRVVEEWVASVLHSESGRTGAGSDVSEEGSLKSL